MVLSSFKELRKVQDAITLRLQISSLFLARVVFAEAISSLNLDEFNSKLPPKYSGMETLMLVQSFAAGSTSFYQ